MITLESLIEEHARLEFSDFHSTLFAIFHVINEKFHPARLLIHLVKKQAGGFFFQPCLFIPVCSSIKDFRRGHQVGLSTNLINKPDNFFLVFVFQGQVKMARVVGTGTLNPFL